MYDRMKPSVPLLVRLAFCIFCSGVWSFEKGAPASTCLTMFPKHDNTERWLLPCPFNITVSSPSYTSSQLITVTIAGPPGRTFRGVQIRAHRVRGDRETILGSFESFPNDLLKPFSCFGGKNNMLTHKSATDKPGLTLTWRAPPEPAGDVVFTATIVETFKVFWIDQNSPVLVDPTSSNNLGDLEEVSNSDPDIVLDGCGESKGCLLYPRLCRGSSCDAAVSFRLQNDWVHFEMMGKAEGYVSMGFSDDIKMKHDETLSCTAQGSRVTVQHGYNPALYNERQYTAGIVNMTTMQKDGVIYCRFSRPRVMSVTSVHYSEDNTPNVSIHKFDLGLDWYLMLAWGYTYQDTDVIGHHKELPIVTHKKFSLSSTDIHYGTTFSIWLQLHSSLAVFSWMLLVGCASVISRHYREGFGANMTCGAKLWFQLHRYLIAAAFCSMAVSFILIFVHLQDWSKYAGPHMYLGVAVMVAMVLQIFAGLLRPSPASKFRPVFNWGHKIFGKVTHIASGVEMSLGFGIPLLPYGMRYYGAVVVFTYIGVQIAWEITLDIVAKCKARKSKSDYDVSNQFKLEEKYPEKTNRASHIMLAGYIVSMLTLTVCTIVVIKFY